MQKVVQWYDNNTKELDKLLNTDKYFIKSIQTIPLRLDNKEKHLTFSSAVLSPKSKAFTKTDEEN